MQPLEEQAYCIYCYTNYDEFDEDGFDYRFDEPTCFNCVDELELEPSEEDPNA